MFRGLPRSYFDPYGIMGTEFDFDGGDDFRRGFAQVSGRARKAEEEVRFSSFCISATRLTRRLPVICRRPVSLVPFELPIHFKSDVRVTGPNDLS